MDQRLRNDDLWITLDGVESAGDGTGALLENPSDIIQALHTRWMGMTGVNIDAVSFAAAKTNTALLKMGFALTEQRQGLELCADLAFQSRCSEVFFAGKARLIYLTNVMTPVDTPPTTGADRYLGSLDIARREWNQVVTEITGAYVDNGIRETIIVRSSAAETFVGGRRARTVEFWAYASLPAVKAIATFWLNRWQYIWQQIALVDSLRRLDAEPYDLFDLDLAGWFGAGQVARVIGVEHTLGGGSHRAVPGIRLSAEIPYFPEGVCDTIAEAMPPGGCWACENSCQLGCELFCTAQAMIDANQTTAESTSTGATAPHTTRAHTAPHTAPHTARHTTPLHTAAHTAPHTAPHTAAHTSPHTTGSPTTEPPGYPCSSCSEGVPSYIRATFSSGGTFNLYPSADCVFSDDHRLISFGSNAIEFYYNGNFEGLYGISAPYDCFATYVITLGGGNTLTISGG